LGSDSAEVIGWDIQEVHRGIGGGVGGSAIYRFEGQGREGDREVPWSLILKVLWVKPGSDLSDPYYWRREADAYASGWLDDLPGDLAAPRCCGIVEQSESEVWIWLEAVVDEVGPRWPLERYGLAARHLGQFNGTYLGEHPLPSYPWLSSGWLRKVVVQSVPLISALAHSADSPWVRRWLPGDTLERVLALWAERETFLDALDRLPHTLCHLDAFRRNLFARRDLGGDEQTVAIDWAFVGTGALGEDIEPLVNRSLAFLEVDAAQARELDRVVFSSYLEGLQDAGWHGDPLRVRMGCTAAAVLRWIAGIGQILPVILDESRDAVSIQVLGHPFDQVVDRAAENARFFLTLADEAQELLGDV
jgi:hypothetical protein